MTASTAYRRKHIEERNEKKLRPQKQYKGRAKKAQKKNDG